MITHKDTVIRLETGQQFSLPSKVEVRLTTDVDKKSLHLHLFDCSKSIMWEVPLNLRGLRKLERLKVAIETAERELLANIEYKED